MAYPISFEHADHADHVAEQDPRFGREDRRSSDRRRSDRRSSDPIDRLSRDLNVACTTAINPHQVAALLEAEGINDRIARERYLSADVFSLAADLYQRVPLRRRVARPAAEAETQQYVQQATGALVMRGPMYLLPALFFVAAKDFLERPNVLVAGLVALLLAWSWNQGFGALVHRLVGKGNVPAAMSMSRLSLLAGTTAVALTAWLAVPGASGDIIIGLFVWGQTAYLIAAATLLTLGHDRLLAMAMVPGVATLGVLVIPGAPAWIVGAAMVLTLLLVLAAAAWATRGGKKEGLLSLPRSDWLSAGAHAVLGAVWAILIGLAGFSIGGTSGVVGTVSVAAAPMVLTMGVAEWRLLRIRRAIRSLLLQTRSRERFANDARKLFGRSAAAFATALLAVAVPIVAVSYFVGALSVSGLLLSVGFVCLATAFFAGLTLLAMGRIGVAVVMSILFAGAVGLILAATPNDPLLGAGIYAAGCLGLSFSMMAATWAAIPEAVVHR